MSLLWPVSLPAAFLQANVGGQPNDNAIRTAMETGPMKIRRRDSVRFMTYSGGISVNETQYATFYEWYYTEHLEGAEPFEWFDPASGVTKFYRITAPPQDAHLSADRWTISFQVEEVPS